MNEQLEFIRLIASRLESAGILYMITGSVALAIYAVPRMTRDIDLVIECRIKDIDTLISLFERDCYIDKNVVREAVLQERFFNIIHNEWLIKADFIIRKENEYRKLEFQRRRYFNVEGTNIYVVTAEDLLLSKLHWLKGTSAKLQSNDVKAIIESVPDLDWEYLEKWALQLGVLEDLKKMRGA